MASVWGTDVFFILQQHFPVVRQNHREENVCGGVCGQADACVPLPWSKNSKQISISNINSKQLAVTALGNREKRCYI